MNYIPLCIAPLVGIGVILLFFYLVVPQLKSVNDSIEKRNNFKKTLFAKQRIEKEDLKKSQSEKVYEENTIADVDDARMYEQKIELQKKIRELQEDIKLNIKIQTANNDNKLRSFYIGEYEKLLAIPLTNESDYEHVRWLYNYGNLRTKNEIYVHSGQFEKDCSRSNLITFSILFVFGFFIPVIACSGDGDIKFGFFMGTLPGICLGCFFGLIGLAISHHSNASAGQELNVQEAEPIIAKEIRGRNTAIASAALGAAVTMHNAKKAVKDISNVDSWKEMK